MNEKRDESSTNVATGSVEWFKDLRSRVPLILIGYRGNWCPFCKDYLKNFSTFMHLLSEQGFEVYGLTSQSNVIAEITKGAWKVGFMLYCCYENALPIYLKESGICDVALTTRKDSTYSTGTMLKPFVLVTITSRILYSWASEPKNSNIDGAIGRPEPAEIVKYVIEERRKDKGPTTFKRLKTRSAVNAVCTIS